MTRIFSRHARFHPGKSWLAPAMVIFVLSMLSLSCSQLQPHATQKYFSETRDAGVDEFRWSNGSEIKSIDPAKSITAPESDVIKAVYEGLTDLDSETFEPIPSIAKSWTQSEDGLVWTFTLRDDARWSNGDSVTAHDFVRSWRRLRGLELPESLQGLVENINGLSRSDSVGMDSARDQEGTRGTLRATDDFMLQVSLVEPDSDFAKVVAHPVFRPIHETTDPSGLSLSTTTPITNGAYRFVSISEAEILLEKSPLFWNASGVAVNRVRFVMSENAEQALDEYREGRLDAVTNFDFEPLALKILSSYSDFQRSVYSAVNLYEFNIERGPFADSRVREAFSLALDRERLVQSETSGAMRPASSLVPFIESLGKTEEDATRAKELLAEAGFPDGVDFPSVTLVINRNDLQLRIARFALRSWRAVLGIDVQLEVRELKEMDAVRSAGEFDLIRRGVVFPTPSERAARALLFTPRNSDAGNSEDGPPTIGTSSGLRQHDIENPFSAIPLYFPKSYSLVKPSIKGFSINVFGATSVKTISITEWR